MAAVVASKPPVPQPKMKKPSLPVVQTNTNGVKAGQPPSSSPLSAAKRLPSQPPPATPVSATPTSATANPSRPNRRQQRQSTRAGPLDNLSVDRKTAKKYPEPFVPTQAHIFKKFKGRSPSLIVHLHPTHFRFDQQDGSFSYHSEMRMFIEHLKAGTVPHDMVEEFRKSEVQFYDGWLIVRVVDHCTIKNSANGASNATDDGKPFSIHNYNQYITPSPYAAYPTKEQIGQRSPQIKQDPQNKENQSSDARSDDTITAQPKSNKPKPKVYHVALRPTNLSRQMDLALDALAPDPKSINRKQSQANVNSRGGAPPTPISGVPSTPGIERGPPLKKPKLKIDAKDLLEYEARVINATAPPLYLEVPESYEEAETIAAMLRDPLHDAPPPTAKSRKRTFAELAADDAQAKESERFMLIMDERNPNNTVGTNAAAADAQAGAGIFQPRFEKFNALENIKREIAERKQRDKDRQMQEDEARRGMQAEEDRRQQQMMRQREIQQHRLRQQTEMQQRAHQQAAQQVAAQNQRQQQQQQQASSIPPAMQNQMMQAQPRSSPVLRQGTPHAASSPVVNNPQIAQSQQGAGSPPRPGSAVPHGHPGVPMTRGPSAQGPSRNGTPQIPHSTPGMRNATPILRQGTPGQHMTQASPHGSMMAPTPQTQAAAMQGQGQGVMPQQQFTQQQINALQQRQAQMQAAAQMRGQPVGNGQMNPAQVAQMHAQQQLQQRDAAMRNLQQQHMLQQQQQQQQQQGTPHQMQSPAHPNNQNQYKAQMQEHSRAQISALQQGQPQGSPAPQHMTPQQQAAQMAHQQQQQQQRMMQQTPQQHHNGMVPQQISQQQMQAQAQAQQQQRPQLSGQLQHMYQTALRSYQQQYMQQAAQRYGGNTQLLQPQDLQSAAKMAHDAALRDVNQKRRQVVATAHLRQQQAQAQQNGMMGMQGMNVNMNVPQGQGQGQPGQGQQGGGGGNMQAQQAMQQQAAVNMQNMQMAQAAQMMAQAQHHGNGNGNGGGGGGGQGGGSGNQASMASIAQYQQQLQQMQQQRQG